jgi:hypothetical protein
LFRLFALFHLARQRNHISEDRQPAIVAVNAGRQAAGIALVQQAKQRIEPRGQIHQHGVGGLQQPGSYPRQCLEIDPANVRGRLVDRIQDAKSLFDIFAGFDLLDDLAKAPCEFGIGQIGLLANVGGALHIDLVRFHHRDNAVLR